MNLLRKLIIKLKNKLYIWYLNKNYYAIFSYDSKEKAMRTYTNIYKKGYIPDYMQENIEHYTVTSIYEGIKAAVNGHVAIDLLFIEDKNVVDFIYKWYLKILNNQYEELVLK